MTRKNSRHQKQVDEIVSAKADDIIKKFALEDEFGLKKIILEYEFRDMGLKMVELLEKKLGK